MREARHCECQAEKIRPTASCVEIADLMDRKAVGSVVVVDDSRAPIGMVTDRDLSSRVVAAGRDPEKTSAEDIMTRDIVTADRHESIPVLLERMRENRIRRIPIVEDGMLVGIVTLDDLAIDISSHLFQLSDAPEIQRRESRRSTRARRRREARDDALEELRHQVRHLGGRARDQLSEQLEDLATKIRPESRD